MVTYNKPLLSFSTDVSSNKVFTYKEAMTQEDTHLFVAAMHKEVADHELQNHWTIVHSSNIKLDCVLMGECNNGAQTTGKHTHQ
jgi:hypothetical protein